MKRVFDLICALIAISILIIPMLLLALLIKCRLGQPVFFYQIRPGLKGKPFKLIKFRTMLDAFDVDGKQLPDEARLTSFGRLLRSTSLDELPELWNVLKGDMSLVGPRPLLGEYLSLYNEEQKRRHDVRPGITGWAQIKGRNTISWKEKFELDVWYVDNHSFWLDLKIIFITFKKVIFREGIHSEGHVTVEKFKGYN